MKSSVITHDNPNPHTFPTKLQCIEYIQTNQHLKLFAKDINQKMAKQFIAITYDDAYNLSLRPHTNLYENYEPGQRVKLHLDIDIKIDEQKPENYFDDTIKDSIEMINTKLKTFKIKTYQIIILHANRDTKLSAHIIYNNVYFNDIYAMRHFMAGFRGEKLIETKIIDLNIYRAGMFRLLWNTKYGVDNKLQFYKSINYESIDDKSLFMDCLVTNINNDCKLVDIKIENTTITKPTRPAKQDIKTSNITVHPINQIEKYINLLDDKRADDYKNWLDIGMAICNSNNSIEGFNLWDNWSQKSSKYGTREYNIQKWNSFNKNNKTIATIKYYAKQDNPDKFSDIECVLEKPKFDAILFDQPYLLEKNTTIKNNDNIVATHINKWATNKTIKTLAIQSPYNTGKTTMIKSLLKEYNFKRILFISYRQTLTNELYGNFKGFDFKSYMDGVYVCDRLICQIESLTYLLNGCMFDGVVNAETYDLVIIDEIESVLAHFSSTTIQDKQTIFTLIDTIISNSRKLLVLDGDFHNRAYDFVKAFGKSIIMKNKCKKDIRNFILTNNAKSFSDKIDKDLEDNKKLVLVSMSSSIANDYYVKYKDKYKCVLHFSKSDDSQKDNIKDVENYWDKFDMIIYTPTIEAGVSFDKEYFDKIYFIMACESTSQRGALQMCSRVRQIKDNNIDVYTNNIPFREKSCFFTYDDIKEYIMNIKASSFKFKTEIDNNGKKIMKLDFDLYNQILTHNEKEKANKAKLLFIPYFLKLITQKGHTYVYENVKGGKKDKDSSGATKEEILNTDDIDKVKYEKLLEKQQNNMATHDDKLQIDKYCMKTLWKVDNVDKEFIDKYYGRNHVIENVRLLSNSSKLEKIRGEHDADVKLEQIMMIKDFISVIGFGNVDDGVVLDKDKFKEGIENVINNSMLFKDIKKSKLLFNKDCLVRVGKLKVAKDKNKLFLGIMGDILRDWGLCIGVHKKTVRIKNKFTYTLVYVLSYNDGIDKYI